MLQVGVSFYLAGGTSVAGSTIQDIAARLQLSPRPASGLSLPWPVMGPTNGKSPLIVAGPFNPSSAEQLRIASSSSWVQALTLCTALHTLGSMSSVLVTVGSSPDGSTYFGGVGPITSQGKAPAGNGRKSDGEAY